MATRRMAGKKNHLLGQLATDLAWSGKGIGSGLLKHALERCVTAAGLIGGRALVVNAVDA